MALVIKYFGASSAGLADGSSYANRFALFNAGAWSTEITGFNFSGSDALECRIGPGSYTCSAQLNAAAFTNAPTAANFLLLHGCDTLGNRLAPPDPDWVSAQPAFDDSSLPVIGTTTNEQTLQLTAALLRFLKFTATARLGPVVNDSRLEWCVIENSASTTAVIGCGSTSLRNCVVKCSGTSYDTIVSTPIGLINSRVTGNLSAATGNRRGVTLSSTASAHIVVGSTIINNVGAGITSTSGSASQIFYTTRTVVAGNTGGGIVMAATASQTNISHIDSSFITGNGGYGVNGSAGRVFVLRSRLRDNLTANFTSLGNFPEDIGNDVSAGSDATEFVDATNGDYRVKYGSSFWGKAIGAGDGPATITG